MFRYCRILQSSPLLQQGLSRRQRQSPRQSPRLSCAGGQLAAVQISRVVHAHRRSAAGTAPPPPLLHPPEETARALQPRGKSAALVLCRPVSFPIRQFEE
eukprot:719697-Pleurochrysis_carterae.AAC.2